MNLENKITNNKLRLESLRKKKENLDLEITRLENKILNQEHALRLEKEKLLLEKTFGTSGTK